MANGSAQLENFLDKRIAVVFQTSATLLNFNHMKDHFIAFGSVPLSMDRVYAPRMDCSAISTYIIALFVFILYFTITMPLFRPYGIALCTATMVLFGTVIRSYYLRVLYRARLRRQIVNEMRARRRLSVPEIEMLTCFTHNDVASFSNIIDEFNSSKTLATSDTSAVGCVVCLCDYVVGDIVCQLPCGHCFHKSCITPWLKRNARCPICKKIVSPPAVRILHHSEVIDTTPLDSGDISAYTDPSMVNVTSGMHHSHQHFYNCDGAELQPSGHFQSDVRDNNMGVDLMNPLVMDSMV